MCASLLKDVQAFDAHLDGERLDLAWVDSALPNLHRALVNTV